MLSTRNILIAVIAILALGFVGAIPFAILGLIFGGVDAARDMFILQAILLGSWFPIKFLVDRQIKGQVNFSLPKITLNQSSLLILVIAGLPIIFFLYFNTFFTFLLATLFYRLSGLGIAATVLMALILQLVTITRNANREKELGASSPIFTRVQNFNQSGFVMEIDPDQMQRQEPRPEKPQILFLPEDNLRDRSQETNHEAPPMTITLDPDATSEQSDEQA